MKYFKYFIIPFFHQIFKITLHIIMKFPSIIGEKCTRAPYNLKFWDPPSPNCPSEENSPQKFWTCVVFNIFAMLSPRALPHTKFSLGGRWVHFLGVIFCSNFGPLFFLLLFPCWVFFFYSFKLIYLK